MDLKEIFESDFLGKDVILKGWVKNHRSQKDFGFIDFTDGTIFKTLQVVYDNSLNNYKEISSLLIGSSIEVHGTIIASQGNQDIELTPKEIIVLGECDDTYPLQAKGRPTKEFLREIAYLRPRTNLFQAIFRVRSVAANAIHTYFQDRNYIYLHSPIITGDDCEGSGEMFKLTTLDMNNLPKTKDGKVDFKEDIFGKMTYITGSGQLHGEAFATAFKKIYTFGPTMRSERSNTKIHANEFWMIEPEIAFCDLNELMNIEEDMLKYIIKYVIEKCPLEIEFFDKFVENGLKEKLNNVISSDFIRITHKEAIDLLLKSNNKWEFIPDYESDIAKEHEKYITEYYKKPVFITNWPKDIKAYYMKINDDNKTVAAVDLEVPGAGELMGGSQREENYDKLYERMKEMGVSTNDLYWFLNLRKYGTCVHSGFGLGFERLIIYLTGVDNIRDVIPFPRTPNSCDF